MVKPATVVIGDHTQGLGIMRSAAAIGSSVWVINDKIIALSRFSKHISGYKRVPRGTLIHLGQAEHDAALLTELLRVPTESLSLLFGVNEDITSFIYRYRERLNHKYFIPEVRFDKIYDKYLFNLMLPDVARIETELFSNSCLSSISNPHRFILKGRQGNAFRRITGEKALRCNQITERDMLKMFGPLTHDQVIIQQLIETDRPIISVCSWSVQGQIFNVFGYEKLRQHPNKFGTGTYLRSRNVDSLLPLAEHILRELNFTGISEIEFVYDPQTNTYKVIEMNPRTWKSIHFASQCGQNLVGRYLKYLETGQLGMDFRYACDRYWIDLATDIPQMIRERKLWGYSRDFYECTWDKTDPWPAVALWTLFPMIALENSLLWKNTSWL